MDATPAPRKPRGGRCPGAGAPRGNTNAVKHGLHSRRVKAIASALQQSPEFRGYFRAVLRRSRTPDQARTLALLGVLLLAARLEQTSPDPFPIRPLTRAQVARLGQILQGKTINPSRPAPSRPPEAHRKQSTAPGPGLHPPPLTGPRPAL